MKNFFIIFITIFSIIFIVFNCSDNNDKNIEELLTMGIWEVSQESDQGVPGTRWQFYEDGTCVVLDDAFSMEYQWILEETNKKLLTLSYLSDSIIFMIDKITEKKLILIDPVTEEKLIFNKAIE
jgi:hypothetical protein